MKEHCESMHSVELNDIAKPGWLRVRLPTGERYQEIKSIVNENSLHTVCESAACPNRGECWNAGTATFMILGNVCTRSCGFCNVQTGKPTKFDLDEPKRLAQAVKQMSLDYVVITSVNRDELKDGGASIWAQTIFETKNLNPSTKIEVLLPDFAGNWPALNTVLDARPNVVNHNIETVPRLYKEVRPQAIFERSLDLLKRAKDQGFTTKSGIMLGLGESEQEVVQVMDCCLKVGCDIITVGQYMQPTKNHLPVINYITPETFARLANIGKQMGFKNVFSGPLVRSSYHAREQSMANRNDLINKYGQYEQLISTPMPPS
jgi:lipoyl synthase